MSYTIPPQVYNLKTSEPTESSCGSSWIWIILLIIFLLIIAGLVVWIILLYRTDSKDRLIEFPGANIEVTSDTAIKGTWSTVDTLEGDKVTLYATLHPPIFNKSGEITNAGHRVQSGKISDRSLSLSGLEKRYKYFATLVATNAVTANYQVYTQLVYMDADTPTPSTDTTPNNFAIEDMLQVGKIQLNEENSTVMFEQTPAEGNSLWGVTGSFIQSKNTPDICLFANGTRLGATGCSELAGHTGAMWEYNPGPYANRWCVKGTVPTTSSTLGVTGTTGTIGTEPACMKLGSISNGSAVVSVTTSTGPGDGWVNAFETTS